MLQRLILLTLMAVALTACQTSMLKSFEKVHPGMDKHQVLENLGSPNTSSRIHGKDRWIYRFYEDGIRFDKEIHFLEGVVIYAGETWTPPAEKSAAAVDQRNAESNAKEDAEREARKRKSSEDYQKFQDAAKNNDKVRYMPAFKRVD